MLSLSKPLSGTQVKEYLQKDPLTYYQKDPSESGIHWDGKGAESLGLSGQAEKDTLEAVLQGRDPRSGEVLIEAKRSSKTGEKEHRAGVDLTFSAPKSVSVAALVLGDEKLIELVHEAAAKTREYIEKNYIQSRQNVNGDYKAVNTQSAVWAVSTHCVSRPTRTDELSMDPQLHVHNLLLNMTQRQDGSWGATHNDLIYKDQKELGRVFRNELMVLLKANGYDIELTDRKNTFFELKKIPHELLSEFSNRRQQIVERVQELLEKYNNNIGNGKLYEIANNDTKQAKNLANVKFEDLKKAWEETIEAKGYSINELKNAVMPSGLQVDTFKVSTTETLKSAAEIITKSQSVFFEKDVIDVAIALNPAEHGVEDYKKAFKEMTADIVKLGEMRKGSVSRDVYSTSEMIKIEKQMISVINQSKGQATIVFSKDKVNRFIERHKNGWSYTDGQRQAIEKILTSKDNTIIIQGYAGTGKSRAMEAVRNFAESEGIVVRGLGFTGKAARELQNVGIESKTLHSFLHSNPEIQRGKEIWIVDEASMVSSRQGFEILQKAQENNIKLVVVGDTRQFQSIEAGRFMQDIQDYTIVDKVEMKEIIRQKTEHMQQIVALLQEKKTDEALRILNERKQIHEIDDRQERLKAVAEMYAELNDKGKNVIVLTNTNIDRIALNEMIREKKVKTGQLSEGNVFRVLEAANIKNEHKAFADSYREGQVIFTSEAIGDIEAGQKGEIQKIDKDKNTITVKFGEKEIRLNLSSDYDKFSTYNLEERHFSEKDRIVFLKNDSKLQVENGLTGTIKSIDERGNVIVKTENGKEVRFNIEHNHERQNGDYKYNYAYITHAYALTEYKSQGGTYEHVIWAPDARNQEAVNYNALDVAATRATHEFEIYTNDKEAITELVRSEQFKSSTLDYQNTSNIQQKQYQEELSLSL